MTVFSVLIQYTVAVNSFRLFASFADSHRRCRYLTTALRLVATADRARHCYHPQPNQYMVSQQPVIPERKPYELCQRDPGNFLQNYSSLVDGCQSTAYTSRCDQARQQFRSQLLIVKGIWVDPCISLCSLPNADFDQRIQVLSRRERGNRKPRTGCTNDQFKDIIPGVRR
jgi:hypothetical protein